MIRRARMRAAATALRERAPETSSPSWPRSRAMARWTCLRRRRGADAVRHRRPACAGIDHRQQLQTAAVTGGAVEIPMSELVVGRLDPGGAWLISWWTCSDRPQRLQPRRPGLLADRARRVVPAGDGAGTQEQEARDAVAAAAKPCESRSWPDPGHRSADRRCCSRLRRQHGRVVRHAGAARLASPRSNQQQHLVRIEAEASRGCTAAVHRPAGRQMAIGAGRRQPH